MHTQRVDKKTEDYFSKHNFKSLFVDLNHLEVDGLVVGALLVARKNHHFVSSQTETLFFGHLYY